MINEKVESETNVGAMHKERVTMADGRRYLIYYTFAGNSENIEKGNEKMPEGNVEIEMNEERNV